MRRAQTLLVIASLALIPHWTAAQSASSPPPSFAQLTAELAAADADTAHGRRDSALRHYQAASNAWGTAADSHETAFRAELGASPDTESAIRRAREAVAAARFQVADVVYRRIVARNAPLYTGPRTSSAFEAWANRTLAPFLRETLQLTNELAVPLFGATLALHVLPWQVASVQRLSDLYYRTGVLVRTMPLPPDIAANPTAEYEYNRVRDEQAQRFFDTARAGLERCLSDGASDPASAAYVTTCRDTLGAMERSEDLMRDERERPAATRRIVGLHTDALRRCATTVDESHPVTGRVTVRLQIEHDGSASSAQPTQSTVSSDSANCIAGVLRGLRYPAPRQGPSIVMDYPIEFTPPANATNAEPAHTYGVFGTVGASPAGIGSGPAPTPRGSHSGRP